MALNEDRFRRQYDLVDLSKLILSVMVCAIHSLGEIEWLRPWLSLAVPMFFTFSGFFFFRKWKDNPSLRVTYLPFFKRTATLYLVWFMIWLPVMMKNGGWFSTGIVRGLFVLCVRVVLNSTFTGAWYLSASIIGVLIACLLGKKAGNAFLVFLGSALYVICVLASNYRKLFPEDGWFQRLFVYIYPGTIYNSFPAGVFFISVGKCLAETNWPKRFGQWSLLALMGLLLLYTEYQMIRILKCRVDADCYFALMIVVPLLAKAILSVNLRIPSAKTFRNLSTVNYCMHGGVLQLITLASGLVQTKPSAIGDAAKFARFALAELICISFGLAIVSAAKKWRFLRHLY